MRSPRAWRCRRAPASRRTRRLERAGFIRGYHARLDPFRLDIGLVLFVEVTLGGHRSGESARFETAIGAIPEFGEASHVSGDFDYLLRSSSLTWRNGRTFGIDWSAAIWASIGSPPTR